MVVFMMKKWFLSLPVSRKTIALLLVFVLIPSLLIGGGVVAFINNRQMDSELTLAQQKVENVSTQMGSHIERIQDIVRDLVRENAVRGAARDQGKLSRFTDCNDAFENVLRYDDLIVKFQIIRNRKTVWQYGVRQGYIFEKSANGSIVDRIEKDGQYDLWAPAHNMPVLKGGTYSKECWLASYYCSIYDTNEEDFLGVLAVHMEEDDFSSLYAAGAGAEYLARWVMSGEGELISASDRTFIREGIPEEFCIEPEGKAGWQRMNYNGSPCIILWNRCGDTEHYLFQAISVNETGIGRLAYMLMVIVIFSLFSIGFLWGYNMFVLKPLRHLSMLMENAGELKLKQDIRPVYNDEIGDLTQNFGEMLQQIDELINRVYVEKIKTQEAEQTALLSQINPHFLYNTLDSIRWNAMRNGDKDVGKQLEALSVMLRETLNFGNKYTTLEKELTVIRKYCYLLQVRFRKEIEVNIQIEPEDTMWSIPKLLIQPLVENAYKHGLEDKVGEKKICVKVKRFHERLVIYVADNGAGCNAKEILQQIDEGGERCFALRNIKERIRLEYGDKGKFLFFSHPGKGTLVKLILILNGKETGPDE